MAVTRTLMGLMLAIMLAALPAYSADSGEEATTEAPADAALMALWRTWNDPEIQAVAPFRVFDNLYYVGMEWVAAYLLVTDDGLIVIDTLYGEWVDHLLDGIEQLGFDPRDIRYVLVTHGHFDHAGGAALLQRRYGAKVVMASEDWALASTPTEIPLFAMEAPVQDIVAHDGDELRLGNTVVTFYRTPGHTTGVLSMRYTVIDGDARHEALTLGGVGLNFSGVPQSESYVASYERLVDLARTHNIEVSLPNHAAMGEVFERGQALQTRRPGSPHPFVDGPGLAASLGTFLDNGQQKLLAERAGVSGDTLDTEALKAVIE